MYKNQRTPTNYKEYWQSARDPVNVGTVALYQWMLTMTIRVPAFFHWLSFIWCIKEFPLMAICWMFTNLIIQIRHLVITTNILQGYWCKHTLFFALKTIALHCIACIVVSWLLLSVSPTVSPNWFNVWRIDFKSLAQFCMHPFCMSC